ncbi:fibroblast growth factor 19 [Balaenoptera acutorostrata]|uniref:Fibroblast growth factor n=1 Tax=Balaenoptera acutorostrata TaxID=9767 RepID=A0ABM3U282_BALAC|nr:fibroblast growth factor 19 [Balaenoptera acutorostrata]
MELIDAGQREIQNQWQKPSFDDDYGSISGDCRAGRRRDGDGAQSQAGPKPGLKRHLALARATPLFLREWRSRPVPSWGTIYWDLGGLGGVTRAGPSERLSRGRGSPEPEGGAMRSAPSRCAVARALVLAGLWLAAAGRPLAFSDAGPHVHYGWGESVRLRHLYTAGPQGLSSCFLRIHSDGAVDCAPVQSAHSLMEIRAVALSTVAIKGERSVLYLCMGADGKMQGLSQYSAEDCAFEEEIRPDGYNVYWSKKHHLPVSLSSARQRQLFKSRGFLPLSHFLPMLSTIPTEPDEIQDHLKPDLFALPLKTDSMDPFGLATNLGVVKSPSFYK